MTERELMRPLRSGRCCPACTLLPVEHRDVDDIELCGWCYRAISFERKRVAREERRHVAP